MNYEQREPYLMLANASGLGLCNFCRFAEWLGSWCEADLDCNHSLPVINGEDDGEHPYDVWQGGDCWAFRPKHDFALCGAIAGIAMEGNIPHIKKTGELVAVIPRKW